MMMTKDSPGDSTFETLSTILTIENLNSDNHSYLTINCDTGQHSQFLRCLQNLSEVGNGQIAIDFCDAAMQQHQAFMSFLLSFLFQLAEISFCICNQEKLGI